MKVVLHETIGMHLPGCFLTLSLIDDIRIKWDISVVKPTLELPEALWREADLAAKRAGVPLNDFLVSLLQEKLNRTATPSRQEWPVPPPNVDSQETRRIQTLIDTEFGGIDPDTWR
ncbi:MAG: hypothetical protein JWM99_117 [Verrucomicrobiales bacterium]|nr:hypothetical protein [Verrucomicrobiales bacterium]